VDFNLQQSGDARANQLKKRLISMIERYARTDSVNHSGEDG
jgi:hypothetical protein